MLDAPVAAATGLVGIAGVMYAAHQMVKRHADRTTALMGTMAAFIFAAQMVNFPVLLGVSGHLVGGVLAAVLLGPWAGALVIAAVLIVQCFLFADGGLTVLGANFVNMGLIGSVGGYSIYAALRRWIPGRKGVLIAAMVAAWFSVLLASGALAVELSASGRRAEFWRILSWMGLVHAVIGVGEALITGLVVRFLLVRRPDLFESSDLAEKALPRSMPWVQTVVGGLAIALAVAVFLAPYASEQPDGLEYVAQKLGFLTETESRAPLPDYQVPGLANVKLATAAAGVIGTLAVFSVALAMSRVFSTAVLKSGDVMPDAA
jgi:cobalt/nickel transport system permease protein